MWFVLTLASVALIVLILMDGFEAMILPRRVTRWYRLTRMFYLLSWRPWSFLGRRFRPGKWRETFLSVYGPLSLLGLISAWVAGLIVGFAVLHWSLGTPFRAAGGMTGPGPASLATCFYLSGVTFFTLGFGDVTPTGPLGRVLAVAEAGVGFGFLAIVIGYLPVLYQAFSRREVTISLLDARAGSPPSAGQLLLRLSRARNLGTLDRFLEDWERWAAELLESHLSFPVLSYYRSQHDNQSWLAALTAILDVCAIILAEVKEHGPYQAQLTFAMARHASVDLALVFKTTPLPPDPERLTGADRARFRAALRDAGLRLRDEPAADGKLAELRAMYEPFVNALGHFFLLPLPPIWREGVVVDNWQTSAWMRRTAGIGGLAPKEPGDDHFD